MAETSSEAGVDVTPQWGRILTAMLRTPGGEDQHEQQEGQQQQKDQLQGSQTEAATPRFVPEAAPAPAADGSAAAAAEGVKDGGAAAKASDGDKDGAAGSSGAANPFSQYYAQIIHQQNMLQDSVRTSTYQRAIVANADRDFRDKVVLDVGTGTGILSFFAAQAGAKRVYAVEASDMADSARKLVEGNKMTGVIDIIKEKLEEVTLPEKVDVIISEPIGFLLVHERMLETYVEARDRFLKPGGLMFPASGTIFVTPISCDTLYQEQLSKAAFWNNNNFYGVDVTPLWEQSVREHFSQAVVGYMHRSMFISADVATHTVDFATVTAEQLKKFEVPFRFTMAATAIMHGVGCWFDLAFLGSQEHVTLSTSPDCAGTHWYQCRLLFSHPLAVNATQTVSGVLKFQANDKFSYCIDMEAELEGSSIRAAQRINLQDQLYHYLSHPDAAAVGY